MIKNKVSRKVLFDKNLYLKSIKKLTLVMKTEEYKKYNNDNIVILDNNGKSISLNLLCDLIANDYYFSYLQSFFQSENIIFRIQYFLNDNLFGNLILSKIDILNGLQQIIDNNKFLFSKESLKRISFLYKNFICQSSLKSNSLDSYSLIINDNDYNFSIDKMYEIIFLSETDYNSVLMTDNLKIDDVPKKYYFYAIREYFLEYNTLNNCILPNQMVKRVKDIISYLSMDIQTLNEYSYQDGLNLGDVVINKELRNAILQEISLFETDIEKAIYIYIKMCKILTYDEVYFAVEQDEEYEIVKSHKDISNIVNVTPTNNKVVCYEFNAIYAKLLDELGIITKTYYTGLAHYGKSHMSLIFKFDKFLVKADSVTSIISGDIMQAKFNQKLKGLTCINENLETQQEFSNILTKVYILIKKLALTKVSKNKVETMQTSEDILQEYNIPNSLNLNLYEKLAIIVSKVNATKLIGIDALSYLLQLKKVLFTEEECDKNIRIVLIRNNESQDDIKASAIIVINEEDLITDYYDSEYYLYNPGSNLVPIDRVTLETKFNVSEYQYIKRSSSRIPCLILENRNKQILKKC